MRFRELISKAKITIVVVSFTGAPVAQAALDEHFGAISKVCGQVSTLLIKKSALELNSKLDCKQLFTSQLLSNCKDLSCERLLTSFKKNFQGRSGSVVGE